MPRRRPPPGFLVVYKSPELIGYRCKVCREEFGRDRTAPAPTLCPRVDRHQRAGPQTEPSVSLEVK